jgi:hypothetical protein
VDEFCVFEDGWKIADRGNRKFEANMALANEWTRVEGVCTGTCQEPAICFQYDDAPVIELCILYCRLEYLEGRYGSCFGGNSTEITGYGSEFGLEVRRRARRHR